MLNSGALPGFRIGPRWRVLSSELARFMGTASGELAEELAA
jgi:hypothetical protein